MNALAKALLGTAALGALLLAIPGPAASQSSTTNATPPMLFGMDSASATAEAAAGVKPDYGTFWIGPWTLTSGWGGPDAQLDAMRNAGVTPAIHFYYWGDDISQSCLENGCWSSLHNTQKDKAHWQMLADQLVQHLNARMQGKPALVFLETEFNKGDVATYEPLDGYLTDKADQIHQGYPAAQVVMALGNWDSKDWVTWDRTAAASDLVGIQGMRGSTRQSAADYATLFEGLLAGAKTLQADFHKPIILQDVALSTYPEPDYLQDQADELQQVFTQMGDLRATGVQGLVYRSWLDSPSMSTANYYGEAERHWGLAWAGNGTQKPGGQVWVDGVKAVRAGAGTLGASTTTTTSTAPPPPPPPIAVAASGGQAEAESFATRTTGGLQSDAQASAGKAWNLWANGYAQQSFNVTPGQYDVSFRVRGTPLGGVAPHMVATVAGSTVTADPGTSYTDATVRLSLGGSTDVRVAFTNDAKGSTEDRNLIVDQVRFTPVPVNHAPTASFSVAANGLTASVDGSSSSDPDGQALTYAWTFGDGATGTGVAPSHVYLATGTYAITLTASDGALSASATQSVSVQKPNAPPTAAFTATANQLTAALDASSSSDPDGDALTYAWAFGDGSTGSGRTATHAYAASGSYTVVLTVSDGTASSTASHAVAATRTYTASFTTKSSSNEYWQQEAVAASPVASKVDVQVSGGAWQPMTHQSYGDWTSSLHIAKGTPVAFRATASDGSMAVSATQPWLGSATATSSTSASAAPATSTTMTTTTAKTTSKTSTSATTFKATFTPKSVGNDWWVETAVSANQGITKVEARVGSGAWVQLPLQDWGNYAKSVNAPNGSKITFRATGASGAVAYSSAVTWT